MKLLRYGPAGQEKPGLMGEDGQIRDLSQHVDDIAGAALADAALNRLRALSMRQKRKMASRKRQSSVVSRRRVTRHMLCWLSRPLAKDAPPSSPV